MIIYIFGILSASLTMGMGMEEYEHSYLCGAIGGVYAIIFAHLANIIQNWGEMEDPIIRIIVFFILNATNIGISFYKRSMSGVSWLSRCTVPTRDSRTRWVSDRW